jgi:hypothetical protein
MLRNIGKAIDILKNDEEVKGSRILKEITTKTRDNDGKVITNHMYRLNPVIGSETLLEKRNKMVTDKDTKKLKVAQKKVFNYLYDKEGKRKFNIVKKKKVYQMSEEFVMVDIPEMSTIEIGNTKKDAIAGLNNFKTAIDDGVFDKKFKEVADKLSAIADRASKKRMDKQSKTHGFIRD